MTDDTDNAGPTENQATDAVLPDSGAGLDEDPREYLDHHGVREGQCIYDNEQTCYYLYPLTVEEVVAVAAPNVIPVAGLDPDT